MRLEPDGQTQRTTQYNHSTEQETRSQLTFLYCFCVFLYIKCDSIITCDKTNSQSPISFIMCCSNKRAARAAAAAAYYNNSPCVGACGGRCHGGCGYGAGYANGSGYRRGCGSGGCHRRGLIGRMVELAIEKHVEKKQARAQLQVEGTTGIQQQQGLLRSQSRESMKERYEDVKQEEAVKVYCAATPAYAAEAGPNEQPPDYKTAVKTA
jgi:hypothetical protein